PRFGWKILSEERGVVQEAYEIKVAESSDFLFANKLIWTSGKVTSSASQWIEYSGKELQSGRKYWWQVRVWDNRGNVSAWTEPAFWRMGILNESDWKGGWITVAEPEDSTQPSPMFRREFGLNQQVRSATLYITAHGLYEAQINGKRVGDAFLAPGWTAYQKRLQYQVFDVTPLMNRDKNAIGVTLGSGWWRGNIGFSGQRNFYGKDVALLCMLVLEFSDGSTATISTDGGWKYTTSGPIRSSEIYHGETYNSGME
ncbi:MAG: alpha-L-rhamnosidase N-terminal domain-containing protein, partial [Bacteroidota bacterium]